MAVDFAADLQQELDYYAGPQGMGVDGLYVDCTRTSSVWLLTRFGFDWGSMHLLQPWSGLSGSSVDCKVFLTEIQGLTDLCCCYRQLHLGDSSNTSTTTFDGQTCNLTDKCVADMGSCSSENLATRWQQRQQAQWQHKYYHPCLADIEG